MALIKELNGCKPKIGNNCFIAETAAIVGDVTMGDDCSIWYGAVLRGDVNTTYKRTHFFYPNLFLLKFSFPQSV